MTSRLLLVYGGRSSEHEISIRSAAEVLAALDRRRFDPVLLGIRRDGGLRTGSPDRSLVDIVANGESVADLVSLARDCAAVFPLMHGPYGEDGTFQGLLEFHGLPHVGAGVLASALCMDKAAFKTHVSAPPYHVPVTPGFVVDLVLEAREVALARARSEGDALGYPLFVKPARQGSSIGVAKVAHASELIAALEDAARYDHKVLVEKGLDAREIELAVLGDGGPQTRVSAPGEIVLPPGAWYDYDNKYQNDVAGLQIPAELPDTLVAQLQAHTLAAFRATNCTGLARVDFLVERTTGRAFLNELNTMPGFTTISMYPKLMGHAGIPYQDLVTRLVELGLEEHRRRTALRIDR